jgi:hypothetical protein
MMDWTEELLTQVEAANRVALSYAGSDGYPVVLPFPLVFDRDKRSFTLPMPHQAPVPASEKQASLTLLFYDEQTKSEQYLLFYGRLTEAGNAWMFIPSEVVLQRWRRRA